ncbi:hypothetical protein C2845_PM05G07050 [Panicum miliaceum]|uniref:Uncharacterized protein n=1 Tax=Panicum miliaceum TaxID=4540 RepID=A0A3L6STB7_PANMI|nr:hypothetical protein C2845_PM05G07050 [Panicum miliaceum]
MAIWPLAGSVALPPPTSGSPAIVLPAHRSVASLRIPWCSGVASAQATGVRTKLAGAGGLSHRTTAPTTDAGRKQAPKSMRWWLLLKQSDHENAAAIGEKLTAGANLAKPGGAPISDIVEI